MYQIWQDPKSGVGGLFDNLKADEQKALKEAGMEMVLQLDVDNPQEAQAKFIDWCHEQCPDATIRAADFSKLFK